jgi:DNA-directed RNA polymerase specialized sigma24 family protein
MELIYNESDLLKEVAKDNRAAFSQLYNRHFSLVRQYLSLFEPSKERLDELTQDVFVRIWEKLTRTCLDLLG